MLHHCPACQRSFSVPGFCPFDGTPLIESRGSDKPTVLSSFVAAQEPPPATEPPVTESKVRAVSAADHAEEAMAAFRERVDEYDRLVGETLAGDYYVQRKIGEGGMGVVYRANHVLLCRPTAIKVLLPSRIGSPEVLERFEREVKHMSQLTHPNTVAVFDYGRSFDGLFYYAMEYLDGIDLEYLVRNFGAQPSDRVVSILVQVCGALREAHERGFFHRDIKPANIILCQRGGMPDVAKVVDFGLVKQIESGTGGETAKVVLGTPAYIAPEAVTDPERIGPAVDLYSLGAVGYWLLTGKRLFEGTAVQVCVQHVTKTPVPPSHACDANIPPPLEQLVMSCLAKAAADRPTAPALLRALRGLAVANDWDEDKARRWWLDLKPTDPQATSETPTLTITVDLGERAAGQD